MTFQMLGPNTDTTIMIRIRPGKTIITSVKRMITISTAPPKYPESVPSASAIATAIDIDTMPTASDTRLP